MGLASFSAILEFAIDEEKKAADFTALLLKNPDAPDHEFLKKILANSEKNRKALQMILQENVTEMVMEPCEEINGNDFSIDPASLDAKNAPVLILKKQVAFLNSASKAINLKEVKRAFNKIAEKKTLLISEILK
ncbi:MAG TPA: hypothetical protein PKK26_07655 [Candidatus Wallbacteria bacterium]|nr:hypothetical protein [Candidatus Wallbacteria bacterium]